MSWSIGTTIYSYLKCIVYDKLVKPRKSFRITPGFPNNLRTPKSKYHKYGFWSRVHSEPGGTRWRTGGEVKGKLANVVGSQYSHATSERGLSNITQADAHTSAASSRLNWRPHRFKWTRAFRGKTKSGFCACAIMFRTRYTNSSVSIVRELLVSKLLKVT